MPTATWSTCGRVRGAGADRQPLRPPGRGDGAGGTGIVPWVSLDGGPARPLWRRTRSRSATARGPTWSSPLRGLARRECGSTMPPKEASPVSPKPRRARAVWLRSTEPAAKRRLQMRQRGGSSDDSSRGEPRPAMAAKSSPSCPKRPALGTATLQRSLLALHALTDSRTGASSPVPATAGPTSGPATPAPRPWPSRQPATNGKRTESRASCRVSTWHRGPLLRQRPTSTWTGPSGRCCRVGRHRGGLGEAGRELAGHPLLRPPRPPRTRPLLAPLPDYQEGAAGRIPEQRDCLGHTSRSDRAKNSAIRTAWFAAGDPDSGLDSAAAWAVRPFPVPALRPAGP